MVESRRETTQRSPSLPPLKKVKGGSTSLILRGLDLAKSDPIIVLDVRTAIAHRDVASLNPLNDTKIRINQYVESLIPLKGEKKVVAEQVHQKNQKIDEQIIAMEKKQTELEEQYQEFRKLKQAFLIEGVENPSNRTRLLEELTSKSRAYQKEVKKFNEQVGQTQSNLNMLKRDIQFHAAPDLQRKIEQVAAAPVEFHRPSTG